MLGVPFANFTDKVKLLNYLIQVNFAFPSNIGIYYSNFPIKPGKIIFGADLRPRMAASNIMDDVFGGGKYYFPYLYR